MTRDELLELFDETVGSARDILIRKNKDYSDGDDPWSNFNASTIFDVDPIVGILMRVVDKLKRIQTFAAKGELQVKDEPVLNSIIDVINYMALIRGMIKDMQAKEDPGKQYFEVNVDLPEVSNISIVDNFAREAGNPKNILFENGSFS